MDDRACLIYFNSKWGGTIEYLPHIETLFIELPPHFKNFNLRFGGIIYGKDCN